MSRMFVSAGLLILLTTPALAQMRGDSPAYAARKRFIGILKQG